MAGRRKNPKIALFGALAAVVMILILLFFWNSIAPPATLPASTQGDSAAAKEK